MFKHKWVFVSVVSGPQDDSKTMETDLMENLMETGTEEDYHS